MKYLRYISVIFFAVISVFVIIPFLLPQFSLFLSSIFSGFLPRLAQFYKYDEEVLKKQVIILQEKLNEKSAKQSLFDTIKKENQLLRQILKIPPKENYKYVYAEVTARNPLTWRTEFIIGAGRNQGIKQGCGILANNFLVGQVVEVSANSSVVHTLLHKNIRISCEVRGVGGVGLLSGEVNIKKNVYGKILHLSREVDIADDAVFVTSGLGNLIPRGIEVGVLVQDMRKELTREAIIRFFASFEQIYFVSVITPEK